MLKKLLLTALLSASFAFAAGGMACDANKSGMACDMNGTKCKHKDCKCGDKCKCGENCKCADKKACDCNKTGKKSKKMKKVCEGNCSK
jgi:hypothetical protein